MQTFLLVSKTVLMNDNTRFCFSIYYRIFNGRKDHEFFIQRFRVSKTEKKIGCCIYSG